MIVIKSMVEFQKAFYPSKVGKECPYCGHDLSESPMVKSLYHIVEDTSLPEDEIHIKNAAGKTVVKIINLGEE